MNYSQAHKYLSEFNLQVSREDFLANQNKKVFLGMSGGVDSSVCAVILKLQGYEVVGMFMKNWEEKDEKGICTSEKDFGDVVKVCEQLDIPYYAINFVQEYQEKVFTHFVAEYKNGYTPNPDILCNREIKFKVFFDKAMELGADYLATGHYCQKSSDGALLKGNDSNKDQSYFLYTMQDKILEKVLFPIGSLEKKFVRKIAADFDLATSKKKDSTGICFIGERNFKEFLSKYIQEQKGFFINLETQAEIGEHNGACFYTIGQRKGLGVGGPGGPWFVAKKDVQSNTVYLVEGEKSPHLYAHDLTASELSWVQGPPANSFTCTAKIRYRQKDQECQVQLKGNIAIVHFPVAQRAIALRQSVVFYQNDQCLGGGIITAKGRTVAETTYS